MTAVLEALARAEHILVIQAENPDGDSLASALALEALLEDAMKTVTLYCPVDMPTYLRYLSGWDRVVTTWPRAFDAAIIVDASSEPILERVLTGPHLSSLQSAPVIVIDHHDDDVKLGLKTINLIDTNTVSTGQIIFELAQTANWKIGADAAQAIAASILSDSLGLSSPKTSQRSVEILAACIGLGANTSELDARRREHGKKSADIFYYKGRLIERVELLLDNRLALVHIPWEEIEAFSHAYNPSMLVIDEMRSITDVRLAAAFKTYPDGKVTCKLRANPSAQWMDELAHHFGGGGHPFAAGFKVYDTPYETVKSEFTEQVRQRLEQADANL
jgi:phosphoesterase RecJ-like protein